MDREEKIFQSRNWKEKDFGEMNITASMSEKLQLLLDKLNVWLYCRTIFTSSQVLSQEFP